MSTQDRKTSKSRPQSKRWLRRIHRVLGLASGVFLLLLALTGLALNHGDTLSLATRFAPASLAGALYGIEPPPVEAAFRAASATVASAGDTIFVNEQPLVSHAGKLIGAVSAPPGVLVVTAQEILLATGSGQLVEQLIPRSASLPFSSLGTAGDQIVVEGGNTAWRFDATLMSLEPIEAAATMPTVEPARAVSLSAGEQTRLAAAAMERMVSWARLVTDIHSGRILPGIGRYVADLAALCLLYLGFSGLVIGIRKTR